MNSINVLIACEASQEVCKAFRALGHNAFSCDIEPCYGGHPEWHIQTDVRNVLWYEQWDLIIAHPPCTYLTVTGNRWFNETRYGNKAIERKKERELAAQFFMEFVSAPCKHIAIENPVGYMSTHYRKPDQIIQPYMFGDPYEKKTCLWLKNLPILLPTHQVEPESRVVFKSGKTGPAWYYKVKTSDPEKRARERSKTFPGVAAAMAQQWSEYLEQQCIDYLREKAVSKWITTK